MTSFKGAIMEGALFKKGVTTALFCRPNNKKKLTQIFHLSSGVPLTFFLGTIFVAIVGRRP
jgi:hypothetical protein